MYTRLSNARTKTSFERFVVRMELMIAEMLDFLYNSHGWCGMMDTEG